MSRVKIEQAYVSQDDNYRPEIDGLRAVAILPVVLFHAKLGISGGYVGVDVFFVISGFLITQVLLRDMDRRRFRFADFWARRVRRLFPAYCAMILACVAAGWWCLPPIAYAELGRQVLAAASLVSNIYLWRTADYWGPQAEDSALLHMWSLAVEEQFYLVMPFVLAFLYRHCRTWIPRILVLAACVSFAACVYGTKHRPTAAFYLLPTRAWELLLGSVLACVIRSNWRPSATNQLVKVIAWVGLGLIGYASLSYTSGMPFPGWRAFIPCVGAALFLFSTTYTDSVPKRWLSLAGPRAVGKVSYSLYLWHWPIIVFARFTTPHYDDNLVAAIATVVVSMGIAVLSWRFVETPFRHPPPATSRNVSLITAARFWIFTSGLASIVVVGMTVVALEGPSRFMTRKAEVQGVMVDARTSWVDCSGEALLNGGVRIGDPSKPVEVVVLGSSHGVMYVEALDDLLKEHGIAGASFARGEESPLIATSTGSRTSRGLDPWTRDQEILARLAEWRPRIVICFARWGQELVTSTTYHSVSLVGTQLPREPFIEHVRASVRAWRQCGARVFLVGEVPQNAYSKAKFEAMLYLHDAKWKEPDAVARARHKAAEALFHNAGLEYEYLAVSPLFDDGPLNVRVISPEGHLLYEDDNHLSGYGAKMVVDKVIGPAVLEDP